MSSYYDPIWSEIKRVGYVEVTASKDNARTLEDGVKRIKCGENVARRLAGLVGWSKLTVTRTKLSEHIIKIRFELLYRTDL